MSNDLTSKSENRLSDRCNQGKAIPRKAKPVVIPCDFSRIEKFTSKRKERTRSTAIYAVDCFLGKVGSLLAKWGRCDFQQLKMVQENLERLANVDVDRLCREAANEIAARLLAKVKKRTPVGVAPTDIWENRRKKVEAVGASGKKRKLFSREAAIYHDYWSGYKGGTLRDAWMILPIEKHGDTYIVTIANNTEYASYVEYGHRQTPGRYVPALGKSLKATWVKGHLMLTISTQQIETMAPKLLEKAIYNAVKEAFEP